jgi:hypothetical protein
MNFIKTLTLCGLVGIMAGCNPDKGDVRYLIDPVKTEAIRVCKSYRNDPGRFRDVSNHEVGYLAGLKNELLDACECPNTEITFLCDENGHLIVGDNDVPCQCDSKGSRVRKILDPVILEQFYRTVDSR